MFGWLKRVWSASESRHAKRGGERAARSVQCCGITPQLFCRRLENSGTVICRAGVSDFRSPMDSIGVRRSDPTRESTRHHEEWRTLCRRGAHAPELKIWICRAAKRYSAELFRLCGTTLRHSSFPNIHNMLLPIYEPQSLPKDEIPCATREEFLSGSGKWIIAVQSNRETQATKKSGVVR